mgnify:CR=1 FL=1
MIPRPHGLTEAGLQALADVRTLDSWAVGENFVRLGVNYDGQGLCVLVRGLKGDKMFYGVSVDDARQKAAVWVRGLK